MIYYYLWKKAEKIATINTSISIIKAKNMVLLDALYHETIKPQNKNSENVSKTHEK